MAKFKWSKLLFALMLVLMLALVACSKDSGKEKDPGEKTGETEKGGDNEAEDPEDEDDGLFSIDDFSMDVSNTAAAIDGGEITFGLVSDTPFAGTLNWNFYSGNPDAEIITWFDEPLLDMDEDFNYTQDGAATYEVSEDGLTFTFKIKDGVKWQDGEPLKAEDWAYAIEVISDPDYDGVRFDSTLKNIVGAVEYHDGEADSISGLEVVDEQTLKMTFIESNPSILTGGIWPYALAKHIFKDIPVADMSSSKELRETPIGIGPFKVDSMVPGESITLVKNADYWRGEPSLDKVTIKVIDPTVVVKELEKGTVDLVSAYPTDQYPDNADMSNVDFLGKIDGAYTYIGFKLGDWDKENEKVNYKPDEMKMGDVNLRKAMWYAVDNDAVGDQFYHGLRWAADSLITPYHKNYYEPVDAPSYDADKAKEILDEAGYLDVDGDGMREDRDGNPLVINFASMSGGDVAEPIAQYYIQAWKNVGLNVQLLDGRLQEFETFYDRVGQNGDDDPEVDIYQGAWGVGSDVDPMGLYGADAMFNFPRYENEKSEELLKKGLSLEAFDVEVRKAAYKEWAEFMVEEIPVFPTLYRSIIIPVNKRIVNYSIDPASDLRLYNIGISQEDAVVAE